MTNIKFESITPNLMVASVDESITYYEQFGFKMTMSVPEESPFGWAMVQKDEVVLMLQSIESLKDDLPALKEASPGGGLTLFLKMKGVQKLYDTLKDNLNVVDDMRTTFYGMQEFTIMDPNGYYITFAEEVS